MTESLALVQKIKLLSEKNSFVKIAGLTPSEWGIIFKYLVTAKNEKNIFIFDTTENAEKFFDELKESGEKPLYYPDLDHSPYSNVIEPEKNVNARFFVLNTIKNLNSFNLITTFNALFLKVPPKKFFEAPLTLKVDDIIAPNDLALKLTDLGFKRENSVENEGTFAIKGEIFDIHPVAIPPVRIIYFDELIEEIFEIDRETLKTKRDKSLKSITLNKASRSFLSSEGITNLRNALPMPPPSLKKKYEYRKYILEKAQNNESFDNFSLFTPLFFKEPETILDYLDHQSTLHLFNEANLKKEYELFLEGIETDFELQKNDEGTTNILPGPSFFYVNDNSKLTHYKNFLINETDIEVNLDLDINSSITLKITPLTILLKTVLNEKNNKIFNIIHYLKTNLHHIERFYFVYLNTEQMEKFFNLMRDEGLQFPKEKLHLIKYDLPEGFFIQNEKILFLSENDLINRKVKKTKKKKTNFSKDLFAEQLSTLKFGDYVIHAEYGVGIYEGLVNLTLNGNIEDFLLIKYDGGDKVYVPVYKFNLVQKHADSTAQLKVSNLNSKKFNELKSKARLSVKKLAFDLLELQARRKLKKGHSFSPPDDIFREFEAKFPFVLTEDQFKAVQDVLEDMQSDSPMDRLICGDVGFGKTEIAMRAAFKAVLDHKQVSILVPTTILAFQHYESFKERFRDFPVEIEFVSRFKTTKEVNEIYKKLEDGKVDIIIGTHKLLSEKIKYYDLGLVIVDEEHRFGVGHKEKLKVLKENLDFITMTATPIPRTLQLSFLGIKDLSLIQTPPPKRQSIKTYIIKENKNTLKSAIEKELDRGGQVFVVHNRVQDIESYAHFIKTLVPKAKLIYAHGQMSEKELEKRVKMFYEGEHDILLSTTIIESGIDIPRANTMIIDRADTFGLAQLHQLRGRIGRSDKKAYAYFVIPETNIVSTKAQKRLKALQAYADMGAGFSLATQDLEIRGSGDILGPEQSGHIENIGLELYMNLLQDAINELRNTPYASNIQNNIEIITPFPSTISETYVQDPSTRLRLYKRLSNTHTEENLLEIKDEMEDIYGKIPDELNNLIAVLTARIYFRKLPLTQVKVSKETVTLKFNKDILNNDENLRNKVLNIFMARPKIYKINPDYSVIISFKNKVETSNLLLFSKDIAEQMEA